MVDAISQLGYTYDDLALGVPPQIMTDLTRRLIKLGVHNAGVVSQKNTEMESQSELVGAGEGALMITNSGARTGVQLEPPPFLEKGDQ